MQQENMEDKIRHLEMIQTVIQRMASNSFQLKGWTVALVGVIGALTLQGTEKRFCIVMLMPVVACWLLDSYYLRVERRYRIHYKNVAEDKEAGKPFNMEIKYIEQISFLSCVISASEWLFYLPLTVVVVIIVVLFS